MDIPNHMLGLFQIRQSGANMNTGKVFTCSSSINSDSLLLRVVYLDFTEGVSSVSQKHVKPWLDVFTLPKSWSCSR